MRWLAALVGVAVVVGLAPAGIGMTRLNTEGLWQVRSVTTLPSSVADQGSATVIRAGRAQLITRGHASIPAALRTAGWSHVGDPGAAGGNVVDAYQGRPGTHHKLFTVTTAAGAVYRFVHRLTAGESFHNSFVAVSPDQRRLVAGEWGLENRLLVFGMPNLAGSAAATRSLPLAGTISLSRPVRDVQGCAFATAASLVCATNDPSTDLFAAPRQLIGITLPPQQRGATVAGVTALLGSVPTVDDCPAGFGETEGVDIAHGILHLSVNSPCTTQTRVFALGAARPRSRPDIDTHVVWTRSTSSNAVTVPPNRLRRGGSAVLMPRCGTQV